MDESKIKNDNYIVIQGWMVNELGLKGNSLLIYAIIYGFSQAKGQTYNGSLQYLADWTNSTKRGVMKSLKKLCDDGLIQKSERVVDGVKSCEYRGTKFTRVVNKVRGGGEQSSMGYGTKFTRGMELSSPNNIDIYNIEDNKDIYKKESKKEKSSYDDILDTVPNEELKNSIREFIKMRKLIKKPLTNKALELAIKKLDRLADNDDDKIQIVNNAVMNSWQSFYPLKKEETKAEQDAQDVYAMFRDYHAL